MSSKEVKSVGVVGLGYVGLPLAVAFARAGCDVVAVDLDPQRVEAIRLRCSYIEDVPSWVLEEMGERICPSVSFAPLSAVEAVIVCVPTPLTGNREPDLSPLLGACSELAKVLRPEQLVVVESTTYPGTTRERIAPLLEESGLTAGEEFSLAFSPERIDPGRTDFTLRTTPKVVGGITPWCTERATELYETVCERIVPVSSPDAAELTKLLENIFRSVNIALVNELSILSERMGIDIREVIDAASTKPYGFMRFDPGPGMGGHCLPVDPFYLAWRARQFDMSCEFIELAGKINQQMPYHCAKRVRQALNTLGKPLHGSRIALFGVSYKPAVGDTRESPALKIISLLAAQGAKIRYHDPYVDSLPTTLLGATQPGEAGPLKPTPAGPLESSSFQDTLEGCDVAVIVTAHPGVDHELIAELAPAVVDLRGVLPAPSRVKLAAA